MTDRELLDVRTGIGRRHYTLMSSAVCYTFEHKTVVVTGTTKEKADNAMAAVKVASHWLHLRNLQWFLFFLHKHQMCEFNLC